MMTKYLKDVGGTGVNLYMYFKQDCAVHVRALQITTG